MSLERAREWNLAPKMQPCPHDTGRKEGLSLHKCSSREVLQRLPTATVPKHRARLADGKGTLQSSAGVRKKVPQNQADVCIISCIWNVFEL